MRDGGRPIRRIDPFIVVIVVFAALNCARVWLIRDIIWDDNCWMQIIYATSSLSEFLDLGFVELRREPLGVALYPLLSLHESGPWFYVAWHGLNMATELTSPLLLYGLVRRTFESHRSIALMAALAFTAFHLDHTVGYVSAINYRLGLLLFLISLYLTVRGVAEDLTCPSCLVGALLSAWIGSYVFMEAMVAVEPARLILIGYLVSRHVREPKPLIRRILLLSLPFLALGSSLILFKLMYKPYGLYAGAYSHHFDWNQIGRNLGSLLHHERRELARAFHYWTIGPLIVAAIAAPLVYWLFSTAMASRSPADAPATPAPSHAWLQAFWRAVRAQRTALLFGFIFLLLPAGLLIYADRALGGNMNSSHAAPLQIGWSLIAGTVLWAAYTAIPSFKGPGRTGGLVMLTCLLTAGTLVNNKYMDLYLQSWEAQSTFWRAFQNRFPSLPDRAVVFFDVDDNVEFSDLRIYYDFEFQMNILYAPDRDPATFHRYRAYTMEEFLRLPLRQRESFEAIDRETHFGKERLLPQNFIVVRYRPGELLVNREILAGHPDVLYRAWLNKDFPDLPPARAYPLHERMERFE